MRCTLDCIANQVCTTCRRTKAPVGRSMPMEMCGSLCDDDCGGYRQDPKPGHLWPNETSEIDYATRGIQ